MPAGSSVLIFDASCGFDAIFCAIGFTVAAVVVVPPVVPPLVVVLPDVVVVAVLCELPCVFGVVDDDVVVAFALPCVLGAETVTVFGLP